MRKLNGSLLILIQESSTLYPYPWFYILANFSVHLDHILPLYSRTVRRDQRLLSFLSLIALLAEL